MKSGQREVWNVYTAFTNLYCPESFFQIPVDKEK